MTKRQYEAFGAERQRHFRGTLKYDFYKGYEFSIPWPNNRPFYEHIDVQEKCHRDINGSTITFLIERLQAHYTHVCSVDDICEVLRHCPAGDLNGINLVILRQPKKKEEILSPCWGRMRYEFMYHGIKQPALIIEAVNINKDIVIKGRGMSLHRRRELDLLRSEGHEIEVMKRKITVKSTLQSVRQTQLYRTVAHEVGHYVSYKANLSSSYDEKEARADAYAKMVYGRIEL